MPLRHFPAWGLLAWTLTAAAAVGLHVGFGWRHGVLWLIAVALGIAFLQSAFGFTGAYRRMLADRRTAGVRAQLVLLGTTAILFAITFAMVPGVRGFVFPAGTALLLGAFLFGIGMQLGGGCGSGTLYAAGGGNTRMWITLLAFVAGSTLAAWQWELWRNWPALPPISLAASFGPWPALALTLGILSVLFVAARAVEVARHGRADPLIGPFRSLRAPWPPISGAIAIALLSLGTLLVAERPWAITAAFPLWGSRLIELAGLDDPAFWDWWEDPTRVETYLRPVLADRITVMDLGVISGAFLATTLTRASGGWRLPTGGEIAASIVGGLLLGIGAMLATGCNISAFLAGVASFSLHGWAWILPALAGNALGLRIRPVFGISS